MTPSYYVFVAGDLYDGDRLVKAREIADTLLEHGIWLIWKRTPYQNDYQPGDRILIYLARSGKCEFIAVAELASGPEQATRNDLDLADSLGLIGYDRKMRLRNIQHFEVGKPIRPLVEKLRFIKNKRWWGHHFRQSAMRIPEVDFERIVKG